MVRTYFEKMRNNNDTVKKILDHMGIGRRGNVTVIQRKYSYRDYYFQDVSLIETINFVIILLPGFGAHALSLGYRPFVQVTQVVLR